MESSRKKPKAIKIAVSGYYGFGNTGDEAILLALKAGFKDCIISVLDKNNRLDLGLIIQSDVFISGGGGLLQDSTSIKSFLYYAGLIVFAKLFLKKVFIFAQSIGPVKNPICLLLLKFILNISDITSVRDETSIAFIKSLNVYSDKIHKTADPTFIMGKEDIPPPEKLQDGPSICVCPRLFKNMPKDFETLFAGILDMLIIDFHANIYFLSFQAPQDELACNNLIQKMHGRSQILKTDSDILKIIGLISIMDIVIGARLHSLIFAVKSQVPALGITYDPKVKSFMDEVALPIIDPFSLIEKEKIVGIIKNMIANKVQIRHDLEVKRQELLSKAKLNFEMLDQNIGGE